MVVPGTGEQSTMMISSPCPFGGGKKNNKIEISWTRSVHACTNESIVELSAIEENMPTCEDNNIDNNRQRIRPDATGSR